MSNTDDALLVIQPLEIQVALNPSVHLRPSGHLASQLSGTLLARYTPGYPAIQLPSDPATQLPDLGRLPSRKFRNPLSRSLELIILNYGKIVTHQEGVFKNDGPYQCRINPSGFQYYP